MSNYFFGGGQFFYLYILRGLSPLKPPNFRLWLLYYTIQVQNNFTLVRTNKCVACVLQLLWIPYINYNSYLIWYCKSGQPSKLKKKKLTELFLYWCIKSEIFYSNRTFLLFTLLFGRTVKDILCIQKSR